MTPIDVYPRVPPVHIFHISLKVCTSIPITFCIYRVNISKFIYSKVVPKCSIAKNSPIASPTANLANIFNIIVCASLSE